MKIDEYFSRFRFLRFKKGEFIIQADENIKYVYYLKSGAVRQFIISPEGKELTIHIFTNHSLFPLINTLLKIPNNHYFQAWENSLLYIIPVRIFRGYLKENPDVSYLFIRQLLRGLEGMTSRIETVSLGDAKCSVASILIYLSHHKFNHKFTHEELSTLTGLTREKTSLVLEEFVRKKYISIKERKITIENFGKLKDLSLYL